jgi:hypothetical protein
MSIWEVMGLAGVVYFWKAVFRAGERRPLSDHEALGLFVVVAAVVGWIFFRA